MMDVFFEFLKAFFVWLGDNITLVVVAAFCCWLIRGYVRWCRRFDSFCVRLLRAIAVIKILVRVGDKTGAIRLFCDLIYSDDLLLFTNSERAGFIFLSDCLADCITSGGDLSETCNKIADHSGRCYHPFRHIYRCPGEFLKTLFH